MTVYIERDWRLAPAPESSSDSVKSPRPTRRWFFLVCVLAAVVFIVVATDQLLRPQKFPLHNIRLSGAMEQVDRRDIETAIGEQVRDNYFSLNLEQIEKSIMALPWVNAVEVRRRWPRSLDIHIREQRPVASWGENSWMNSTGDVFTVDFKDASNALPRFNGPADSSTKMLEHYRRWANVLIGTGLQIKNLTLSARHEWTITVVMNPSRVSSPVPSVVGGEPQGLQKRSGSIGVRDYQFEPDTSISINLGRRQVDVRLARFARVFKEILLAKAEYIDRVDLRYPNGFALLWKEQKFESGTTENTAPNYHGQEPKFRYSNLFGLELEESVSQ